MVDVKYMLVLFLGKLTQYDARCAAKGDRNLYRLGLLLEAHSKLAADLADMDREIIDHATAMSFRAALSRHFIVAAKGNIAPVSQILRALEKAVKGERPRYDDKTLGKTHVG